MDRRSRTLFPHSVAIKRDFDRFMAVVEDIAGIEWKNEEGRSLLSASISSVHTTMVAVLLRRGANIESTDKLGRTSLSYASLYGNDQAVQLLLECEANMEWRDSNGQTPLSLACQTQGTDLPASRLLTVEKLLFWGRI